MVAPKKNEDVDEVASLSEAELEAAKEQASDALEAETSRPTRADLIHRVDPSWKEGDSVSHLQAITGPEGSVVRYLLAEGAPGVAD